MQFISLEQAFNSMNYDKPKIVDTSFKFKYLQPGESFKFPAKINIHIPIRNEAYRRVVDVNRQITAVAVTEIDFGPQSFQIPHITLYMGFVQSKTHLEAVLSECQKFADTLSARPLLLSQPYLKVPGNSWIFMDVLPPQDLLRLKVLVSDLLRPHMVPVDWDIVKEPPHVTVGYVRDFNPQLRSILGRYDSVQAVMDAVEVSFSGARGSCLGSIRTFEVRTSQ